MRMMRKCIWYLALLIVVPSVASVAWSFGANWPSSFRDANWSSSGTGTNPRTNREAIIQVYAARAGRWKGIFGVHTWILLKPAGARRFERFEVVGWGRPVRRNIHASDAYWYSNLPYIVRDVRGPLASRMIPKIRAKIARYPANQRGDYQVWPGPNSNSFVAWVARAFPELEIELPPTAVGKDYIGPGMELTHPPSGTGWQVTFGGYGGLAISRKEGLELHLLGGTIGIDPDDLAIKLPAVGAISLYDLFTG